MGTPKNDVGKIKSTYYMKREGIPPTFRKEGAARAKEAEHGNDVYASSEERLFRRLSERAAKRLQIILYYSKRE